MHSWLTVLLPSCSGFFPRNGCPSGERFLSQLAAATGGTFQVYNADLPVPAAAANIVRNAAAAGASGSQDAAAGGENASPAAVGGTRVWDSELGAFVAVDLAKDDAATRDERLWGEQQMKALRLANKRWAASSRGTCANFDCSHRLQVGKATKNTCNSDMQVNSYPCT
jgi:hypothetical protein